MAFLGQGFEAIVDATQTDAERLRYVALAAFGTPLEHSKHLEPDFLAEALLSLGHWLGVDSYRTTGRNAANRDRDSAKAGR
jgi:hypothetical protein